MPDIVYANKFKHSLVKGDIDFDVTNPIRCALMNATFTFNRDAHNVYSDISGQLAEGFATNPVTATNVVITRDDVNDYTKITCDTIVFTANGTASTSGVIFYYNSGNYEIIGYGSFGGVQNLTAGQTLTITNLEFRLA